MLTYMQGSYCGVKEAFSILRIHSCMHTSSLFFSPIHNISGSCRLKCALGLNTTIVYKNAHLTWIYMCNEKVIPCI